MSKNVAQVYLANPITTIGATDLVYVGEAGTTDAAISGADLITQFAPSVTGSQVQAAAFNSTADTGVDGTAYIGALTPTLGSYYDNLIVIIKPNFTNTTRIPTLNIDGLGDVIISNDAGTNNGIAIGDIVADNVAILQYNASLNNFFLLNPQVSISSAWNVPRGYLDVVNDSGVADAYTADLSTYPSLGSWNYNTRIFLRAGATNTGASTFEFGSLGALPLLTMDGSALTAGQIQNGALCLLTYTSSPFDHWQLLNPFIAGGGATDVQVQDDAFNTATDSGAVDAHVVDLSPVPSVVAGFRVTFMPTATNTSPVPTLDLNSAGAAVIKLKNGNSLLAGDIDVNTPVTVTWNASDNSWFLENPCVSFQTYYVTLNDSGAADAYVVQLAPNLTTLTDGMTLTFNPANNNTGASTLEINGVSTKDIVKIAQAPLDADDLVANTNAIVVYSLTNDNWQLINPQTASGGGVTDAQVQANDFNTGVDSGAADAYDVAVTPAITSPYPGMLLAFTPANGSPSGSSTIALNGGSALSVYTGNGIPNAADDFASGVPIFCIADGAGSSWQLINPLSYNLIPNRTTRGDYFGYPDQGVAANAYVATAGINFAYQPSVNLISVGTICILLPANTNTGASTLDFNGLGATSIVYKGAALVAGDIVANQAAMMLYDGTNWQLINSQN